MQVKSSLIIERPIGKTNDTDMEEIVVTITGDYHPYHKGRFVKGEGQVEPDEDESLEDVTATYNGKIIDLTKEEMERAEKELFSIVGEDNSPDNELDDDTDRDDRDYSPTIYPDED